MKVEKQLDRQIYIKIDKQNDVNKDIVDDKQTQSTCKHRKLYKKCYSKCTDGQIYSLLDRQINRKIDRYINIKRDREKKKNLKKYWWINRQIV